MSVATAAAEPLTVVALGDSLTQGYGLATDEGLVPQLQRWLALAGEEEVTLVNAGVSGDTTAGGLARIAWTLSEDADALILALGGNDMLRGLPPSEARANLAAMIEEAQMRRLPILLVGLRAPGNFGPDYRDEFDRIYPDLATGYGTLLVDDLLAPIAAQPDRTAALREFMQHDGLHPNAKGVALIVEALGPRAQELMALARAQGPD